jgi:predicted RNase H-like nuclease
VPKTAKRRPAREPSIVVVGDRGLGIGDRVASAELLGRHCRDANDALVCARIVVAANEGGGRSAHVVFGDEDVLAQALALD